MDSPKQRLLKNDSKTKAAAALLHSELLEEISDIALLELIQSQPFVTDSAIADAFRAQGARMYRETLLKLADANVPTPTGRLQGLDYTKQ